MPHTAPLLRTAALPPALPTPPVPGAPVVAGVTRLVPRWVDQARATEHRQMQAAFERCGGLTDSEGLVRRMGADHEQPISQVARAIVGRRLVHLTWRGTVWLPLFQFALPSLALRPAVTQALLELRDDLDDWAMALWFATDHPMLDGRTPAAVAVDGDGDLVDAARADRFVLRG